MMYEFSILLILSSGLTVKEIASDTIRFVNDECLPDDAAEPPSCQDYTEKTYIPHPFNCSRFWECEPTSGHCLNECSAMDESGKLLYFNPTVNVCDWPWNVNCTMSGECNCQSWQQCISGSCTPNCKEDSHCPADSYCDFMEGGSGNCIQGCRDDDAQCGECGTCSNHHCILPECCQDSDCQSSEICNGNGECEQGGSGGGCTGDDDCGSNEYCNAGTCTAGCSDDSACPGCASCVNNQCVSPECCVNSDCGAGEYCNVGVCTAGCSDDTACPGCSTCLNHQCTQPECCSNSDCTDPSKPVCSPGNVCTGGSTGTCYKDSDCQGSGEQCDDLYSNCNYCNQLTGQCTPGCVGDANCDGYHCNSAHACAVGLKSITLETERCEGCQGTVDEDGPFLVLVGSDQNSCNTMQLDHPDTVDYQDGKIAEFSERSILQSCYKHDLGSGLSGGSVHWTASVGVWTPARQQIQFNWSSSLVEPECCCLDTPSLSPDNYVTNLGNCNTCSAHPGC